VAETESEPALLPSRCAKEGIDDSDKSVLLVGNATPRHPISPLDFVSMHIARFLLDIGGGVFVLLGLLHALYTYLDIERPRRLVPKDPAVAQAMARSDLRLSGTGTTMWRAWVGFNFSHSVGVVVFGMVCIGAGAVLGTMVLPAWILFVFVFIALIYLVVGLLYWFRIPVAGIAVALVCLLIAWLMYTFAGA
jgi:hypothetical protein